jgi:hypothetical protein
MSFLTNLFFSSTKTDEDLDKFINKKFTYYLNNSNLLLTFVSDFEDYKSNNRDNNKSKCDECESLYILTSEIFENYINRVKIPFNINIYSEGKEKSGINYNNKVLYFFDLKDLNKILQSKNLAKSTEDTKILNKKKILCKIISLSFIKIYIIIKSIFQTFNIYSSLIKNKNTIEDPETRGNIGAMPEFGRDADSDAMSDANRDTDSDANRDADRDADRDANRDADRDANRDADRDADRDANRDTGLGPNPEADPNPDPGLGPNPEAMSDTDSIPDAEQQEKRPPEVPPISGGGGIFDFLNPFPNKATSQNNDITDEPQRMIRLQTSNNVFYSLFVILFANTQSELTAKNFTASYLSNSLNTISNELFNSKLPTILKYICDKNLFESNFISKNSIVFNDNNFKFLKFKTSDALEKDAAFYLKDLEDKYNKNIIDNAKKMTILEQCFTKENIEFLKNYCANNNNSDLTKLDIANTIKSFLQKMITNYFKNRSKLYDSIIKKLIIFDPRTNEITNINPGLTYAKIIELTEQTKDILLDLHIDIFKLLNSIIYTVRNRLLQKNAYKPNTDTNTDTAQQDFSGGKTRKRYYKKNYKNYKNYKKNKKYTRKS